MLSWEPLWWSKPSSGFLSYAWLCVRSKVWFGNIVVFIWQVSVKGGFFKCPDGITILLFFYTNFRWNTVIPTSATGHYMDSGMSVCVSVWFFNQITVFSFLYQHGKCYLNHFGKMLTSKRTTWRRLLVQHIKYIQCKNKIQLKTWGKKYYSDPLHLLLTLISKVTIGSTSSCALLGERNATHGWTTLWVSHCFLAVIPVAASFYFFLIMWIFLSRPDKGIDCNSSWHFNSSQIEVQHCSTWACL